MNILYIANIRLPTEKAHGTQIVNTCVELNKICRDNGLTFELIISNRSKKSNQEIFNYYQVKKEDCFRVKQFSTNRLFFPEWMSFCLQELVFVCKSVWYIYWRYGYRNSIIYSRDEFLVSIICVLSRKVFWESHEGKRNLCAQFVLKFARGLIVISRGLKDFYKGLDQKHILVAPDAVDLSRFKIIEKKHDILRKLGLVSSKRYVTYIGSVGLYDWKGVDVFLEASKLNSSADIVFLVVGGEEKLINKLKKDFPDVLFVGRKNHTEIPLWQKASDILVIPNKKGNNVSEKFTSPMKLFEYMASGIPILASDLPSLKEVLNEKNAVFFEANNAGDLYKNIQKVLRHEIDGDYFAQEALIDVQKYTYKRRAESVFDFVKQHTDLCYTIKND